MKRWRVPLILMLASLVLGIVVSPEPPSDVDLDTSREVQSAVGTEAAALEVTSAVLMPPWNVIASIVLAFVVYRLADGRRALFILGCTLISMAAVEGAKLVYARSRPPPDLIVGGTEHSSASYPSGHVGFATGALGGLAFLVARRRRGTHAWFVWVLAALGVAWVALSRIYLGRHYVTDTIGGALMAAAVVAFFARFILRPAGPPA